MSNGFRKARALMLSTLVIASIVVGSGAFTGAVAAATNTSITPNDDTAGASGVTYTADGNVELSTQKTLNDIDVHLSPADVSDVGPSDIQVYVDGSEYTDEFSEFDSSGGTVSFKLSDSRILSDGDPVRVDVDTVTNPSEDFAATVSLRDSSDVQFEEYQDTVDIDTSANVTYSNLTFNDSLTNGNNTTIGAGEDLNLSATVENTADQEETYNASLRIDGSVVRYNNGTLVAGESTTTTFTTNFSDTGTYDTAISDELNATEVTVTGPMSITDGSANPSAVESGTTVSNQQIHVEVGNVSQDGDTDWHYVEFPDSLAGNVSVNSATADNASITSSANLVDGYDEDGTDETVKFATSGDGGSDVDLNLTVDASVTYPSGDEAYGIDARVVDSGGETSEVTNVTTINAGDVPSISNYTVSSPTDRDVAVSFNSSDRLADITVDITNSSGETVETLTEGTFTETQNGDTYTYDASTTLAEDGSYDVTLRTATDANGLDGASGQTQSVRANVLEVDIVDGSADPDQVAPGTTINNQKVTVTLANVSADGDTDTHFIEFPNDLANGLSVNSATVNGSASITQSAQLVEGYDDDNTDETVRFQTDTDAGGVVDLNVTVDTSVDYPDENATYSIDARVEDSDDDSAQQSNVTSITVGAQEEPIITDYAVTNPTDRNVSVRFDSSQELANITVGVSDSNGDVVTLTESDFSETTESSTWAYEATYTTASDGTYTATLTEADDVDNDDGASGESDSATLDSTPAEIVGGCANPNSVTPGEIVNDQNVCIKLSNVSADGDTDWHYVEFPNALAGAISVNSANTTGPSITSSAELSEGYDDDNTDETIKFATSSDAGGDIDFHAGVDVSIEYPSAEEEYHVDAQLVDSKVGSVTQSSVTTIDATTGNSGGDSDGGDDDDDGGSDGGDTDYDSGGSDGDDTDYDSGGSDSDGASSTTSKPTVSDFELVADNRDVDIVVRTTNPADQINVTVDGPVDEELTWSDFSMSPVDNGSAYVADVETNVSGTFKTEIHTIANDGAEASAGQTDTLTVPLPDHVETSAVAEPPWVGNESTHSVRAPVETNSSVVGETLHNVEIEYGDQFANRSGSISSVSDDQSVAALRVISSSGAVKSEMGDTDAVTVNVDDDAVHLDLSDVDSSRKPTLEAGDWIVVRLSSVTNPTETGHYETTVDAETAAGNGMSQTAQVHIQSQSDQSTSTNRQVLNDGSSVRSSSASPPMILFVVLATLALIGAGLVIQRRRD